MCKFCACSVTMPGLYPMRSETPVLFPRHVRTLLHLVEDMPTNHNECSQTAVLCNWPYLLMDGPRWWFGSYLASHVPRWLLCNTHCYDELWKALTFPFRCSDRSPEGDDDVGLYFECSDWLAQLSHDNSHLHTWQTVNACYETVTVDHGSPSTIFFAKPQPDSFLNYPNYLITWPSTDQWEFEFSEGGVDFFKLISPDKCCR